MPAKDHPRARAATEVERAFHVAALGISRAAPSPGRDLDWDFLMPYVRSHQVLPALGHAVLVSRVSGGELPPCVKDALADAAIHKELQNHLLNPDEGLLRAHARHARRVVARAALG